MVMIGARALKNATWHSTKCLTKIKTNRQMPVNNRVEKDNRLEYSHIVRERIRDV